MSAGTNLTDAIDDLSQASRLIDLIRLALSEMSCGAEQDDAAAIAAGIEVIAGNIQVAKGRLSELYANKMKPEVG